MYSLSLSGWAHLGNKCCLFQTRAYMHYDSSMVKLSISSECLQQCVLVLTCKMKKQTFDQINLRTGMNLQSSLILESAYRSPFRRRPCTFFNADWNLSFKPRKAFQCLKYTYVSYTQKKLWTTKNYQLSIVDSNLWVKIALYLCFLFT